MPELGMRQCSCQTFSAATMADQYCAKTQPIFLAPLVSIRYLPPISVLQYWQSSRSKKSENSIGISHSFLRINFRLMFPQRGEYRRALANTTVGLVETYC